MVKEIEIDYPHPVAEMGKRFMISKFDSIDGQVEFSDDSGEISFNLISKNKEYTFDTSKVISSLTEREFIPKFVTFRSNKKIISITIYVF